MARLDDPLRLDAIGSYMMDTTPDAGLDGLVREAAESTEMPIALVSVVAGKIQHFRAAVGLPPDLEESRATSRLSSFCQFVVEGEKPFLVTEASSDTRVPPHLTKAYGLEAYAGVPLRHEGQVIGSLCVIDVKPRSIDSSVVRSLEGLAGKVERRLDAIKTLSGDREASAMRTSDLRLLIRSVVGRAQAMEAQLAELGALLKGFEAAASRKEGGEPEASLANLWALYANVSDEIEALRSAALRAADALELKGSVADSEQLDALRRDARSLERDARELGPLARLSSALTMGAVAAADFARNASVLGEAIGACDELGAVRSRLVDNLSRIEAALAKAR